MSLRKEAKTIAALSLETTELDRTDSQKILYIISKVLHYERIEEMRFQFWTFHMTWIFSVLLLCNFHF